MRIDVVTLFPEEFRGLVSLGVTGRAITDGMVDLRVWNPRDWATDRHGTVDDRPYGGGPGMVLAVEPLRACGQCRECRSGRANICRHVQLLGVHTTGGFAEAVILLLGDPDLAGRLGEAARAHVQERFTWRAVLDRLAELEPRT